MWKNEDPARNQSRIVVAAIGCRASRDGSKPEVVPSDCSRLILNSSTLGENTSTPPHHVLSEGCPTIAATAYVLTPLILPEVAFALTIPFRITVAVQQPLAMQWSMMRASPAAVALGKGMQSRSVPIRSIPANFDIGKPHEDRRHPQSTETNSLHI